jgi:hypothetical protein
MPKLSPYSQEPVSKRQEPLVGDGQISNLQDTVGTSRDAGALGVRAGVVIPTFALGAVDHRNEEPSLLLFPGLTHVVSPRRWWHRTASWTGMLARNHRAVHTPSTLAAATILGPGFHAFVGRLRQIGQTGDGLTVLACQTLGVCLAIGLAGSVRRHPGVGIPPEHTLGPALAVIPWNGDTAGFAVGDVPRPVFRAIHPREVTTAHELAALPRRTPVSERVARQVGRQGSVLAASNRATYTHQREDDGVKGRLCHRMSSIGRFLENLTLAGISDHSSRSVPQRHRKTRVEPLAAMTKASNLLQVAVPVVVVTGAPDPLARRARPQATRRTHPEDGIRGPAGRRRGARLHQSFWRSVNP